MQHLCVTSAGVRDCFSQRLLLSGIRTGEWSPLVPTCLLYMEMGKLPIS